MTRRSLHRILLLLASTTAACLCFAFVAQQQKREGYRDTPLLPGQKWHVHDPDRPYPHEIVPGTAPGAPPSDAIVLFDGKDLSHWAQIEDGKTVAPKWNLTDGAIEVNPGTGDLYSREKFGDCQLHIEWLEPTDIEGSGQGHGNSGVFMMSHYEIQVLDSYRAPTYADGQAAAIYGQWPPLVNPMRKPGEWQTYDVMFQAPKFEGDKVVKPAYVTLLFNGVLVHNHQKINGVTGHRGVFPYEPHGPEEPLRLQDHNSSRPVRFRNIWVRKLADYDQPEK